MFSKHLQIDLKDVMNWFSNKNSRVTVSINIQMEHMYRIGTFDSLPPFFSNLTKLYFSLIT